MVNLEWLHAILPLFQITEQGSNNIPLGLRDTPLRSLYQEALYRDENDVSLAV